MKINTERLLWAGAVALIVIAGATGWLTYGTLNQLDREREHVDHAYASVEALDDLLSTAQDIETGARGYIVTGNPTFLEPYAAASQRLESDFAELRGILARDAPQAAELDPLWALLAAKAAHSAENIRIYNSLGADAAAATVAEGEGKRLMDEVRATIARMEDRELNDLATSQRASDSTSSRLWLATSALGAVALALVVVLAIAARASLASRRRAAESNALLGAIVGGSTDPIIALDGSGLVTIWNPAAEGLFGYSAHEITGRPFTALVPEPDRGQFAANLGRIAAGESIISMETSRLARDGHLIDVSISAFPVPGHGEGTVAAAIFRDITEKRRAELALREAEERFATVVRRSPIPIIVVELGSSTLVDVNDAFTALTGFERDEVVGRNTLELGFWADPADREKIVSALVRDGAVRDRPLELRMRSGETRHALLSAERIDSGGRPLVIAQFVDVTERNRLQQDLDRLFAVTPELICVAGLDGYFKRINPAFDTLGYTREELLAKPFLDFVHADDVAATLAEVEKLGKGATTISFINRYRCKDGSYRWLNWNSVPVVEEGVIFAVARDITAERATQDALREVQERLQGIMDHSPAAIYVKDLEGRYVMVNRHVAELLRRPAAQLLGKSVHDLFPPDAARALDEHDRRVLASNTPLEWEEVLPLVDGERVFLSAKFPLVGPDGQPRYLCGISTEITSRKRAEEALAEASAEAASANRAKSEFLSRMSHELRTPLNVVLGFAQVLEMDELNEGQAEAVGHIMNAGRHLLALIDEVLDISRIEAGRLALSLEPVDLREVVAETVTMMEPLARERGVAIAIPPEGGPTYVVADRQKIRQVLLNLLSNAIKYNHPGGSATFKVGESGGGPVRLSVTDTGPGISPRKMGRLFTPFDRLDAEETTVQGTGLGLALTKHLVEAMGGAIGVGSTVNEGSTFWIELPSATPAHETCPEEPAGAHRTPSPSAATRTVLYIEDNLSNFRLVERILDRYGGLSLMPAMQGSIGIELARQHHPGAILLDLHLPDLPGWEVLRELKEDERTRDIPVIIASADATPGQVTRLLEAGAVAYLTKPIDVRELLTAIGRAFGDAQEAQE